jgi:Tol biopolymer transport system component
MGHLTPEQFQRVERLFFEAARVAPDEQDGFLESACADDEAVRAEVCEMLRTGSKVSSIPPLMERAHAALAGYESSDPKSLLGSRVGAYDVTEILGQGGMGVVYRAHDSRLQRAVAIKALPQALASDNSRMTRFMREARILASLSHPAIATVYDLAEREGCQYLVMELVAGQTLAARLAQGPLRIPEALSVCAKAASALEAAHDAGVVHRDLKPQNVMLGADAKVKVLDFGLAREVGPRGSSAADRETTLVLDSKLTRVGAVLGTPGYMSPEQLRGQAVDRRTDIFALGCLLYECLTGLMAFAGGTEADVAAAVLEREPDWGALPANTPQSVRRLLSRCMTKDIEHRLRDAGDVRLELLDALAERPATAEARVLRRRWWPVGLAGCALVLAVVVGSILLVSRWRATAASTSPPQSQVLRRFALRLPGDTPQIQLPFVRVALSRDGQRMAVSISDGVRPELWVRERDDTDFKRLDGTGGAFMPSFSPDNQWVGYFHDGQMKKKWIAGGKPVTLTAPAAYLGPYQWGTDGMITYNIVWGRGIAQVPDRGGAPRYVTTPEVNKGEFAHISPCMLPDNRTMLFTLWNGEEVTWIEAVDLASGRRARVADRGSSARFARTPRGDYVLYEREGIIHAAPFDVAKMSVTGPATAIVQGVMTENVLFNASYDVADDGTLAYVPGPVFSEQSRLSRVNEAGVATPINSDRDSFASPNFSADGKKLCVVVKGKKYRLQVYDMEKGTFVPVLTEGDIISGAISPDGQTLAYSCNKDGMYSLWVKRLSDSASRRVFQGFSNYQAHIGWSPDNRHVAFSMSPEPEKPRDIWYCDVVAADGSPKPLVTGEADERAPRFSPDGQWVAYVSNPSGVREVFARKFPDGETRQLTVGGGDWPEWSPDGNKVYYRSEGKLHSVAINSQTAVALDRPTVAYEKPFGQGELEQSDYALDNKGRLLLIEPAENGYQARNVNLILNWWKLLP